MHKVKHSYKDGFAGVLRPKAQEKINGQLMKYEVDERVLVNIPIKFTGAECGNKWLVDSNGYQFWIDRSVVQAGRVYGLGKIVSVCNGYYEVKIFEDKFDCKGEYLTTKF